ncbi:protein transporter Sec31 [Streptomyces longhuiensis]|uniref:protein transporter Sec31 n=1 Tax=Streptomyces longhuiensis TaxID=2880933 RepID=UPI001D0A873F|nr:protein transporter Sec31 [Streptomyces longhuiensis]UDM00062.1 protein transporter Sec31 [Streptomyces longhuiensis]
MKTRRITRERLVPHTVDGKTRMVPDDEVIEVPLPPRDWDQVALNTVTAIVTALVLACVVWSTVSIGDLLARVVVEPAAYGAATVFDLAWIALMIIEWLARYTPVRARAARFGGYVALAVAMGAVGAHGWLFGDPAIGIVGAVVSGLAKGTWTILLAYQSVPLDPRTAAFLEQELSEAGAELARIPVDRRVNRSRALRDAERRALEADGGSANPERPDDEEDEPNHNVLPIHPGALTMKDAVRIAWDADIREPDAVRRYVGKAMGKPASPDTVERYLRALRVGA